MLYIDRAVGKFQKRLALIIAVKAGHVECWNTMFNMTTLHCNDQSWSFLKLSDCSIYVKHVFTTFYASPCLTVSRELILQPLYVSCGVTLYLLFLVIMYFNHRPLRIRTDGSHARVREPVSIDIFSIFTITLSNVVHLLQNFVHIVSQTT